MMPSSAAGSPPLARTPLYPWQAARGARFVARDGWQIAETFSSVDQEIEAARTSLAVVDLSPLCKIRLVGQELSTVALPPGAVAGPRPGSVVRLDRDGPVLVCRLTAHELLLLALTMEAKAAAERLADPGPGASVVVQDVTSGHAAFGLLGPRTPDVLVGLTALRQVPALLAEGSCAETSLAGVHALLVHPPGLPLAGVFLYVAWDVAEYVWERLGAAGRAHRMSPLGFAAYQALWPDRHEAAGHVQVGGGK